MTVGAASVLWLRASVGEPILDTTSYVVSGIAALCAGSTGGGIDDWMVVVIIAVTPWGYVWRRYVTAPGDRWR